MKISLCIESVFAKHDFYDRIKIAKDCGVDAIEFWDPSIYDVTKIKKAIQEVEIPIALCCIFKNWEYRMNLPFNDVLEGLKKTIPYGKELGVSTFIALSGEQESKVDSQKSILIENLKRLSDYCEKEGITIVLEALNSLYDHKGYYLDSSYIGFEIVKAVNRPSIKLLFDCYHMQIMEGNLINNIKKNIDFIGHFHSAGVPGRHELHLGETNYPMVIKTIEELGYKKYFGMEYWPSYNDIESIRDVMKYLRNH